MTVLRMIVIPLVLWTATASTARASPRVVVLELRDTIQPASLRYIERGLRLAAEPPAALVVLELDTPGGLLDSVRSMTSAILRSPAPVVVHVTPSGARAASGGFFLLIAADVAAMAPGTNAGAAHPVTIGDDAKRTEDEGAEPSLEKATQDTAALARSLAESRKRSVTAAEEAILESASFTADEARDRGLIDLIAMDRAQLLSALDGRSITRPGGGTQVLQLQGAEVVPIERTFAERVLTVIAAPQVAYLLLMLGAIGILLELMAPGGFVLGVAGAMSLLVGMYGLSVLPVSVSGVLLIVAGLGLLVAEVFVTSYGLLAVAGIASFVVGSLILVESPVPELRIGPAHIIPVAVVLAGVVALLATRAVRSRRLRPQAGIEAMIGEPGRVVVAIDPAHEGKVFVHGEYWTASSPHALPAGSHVRVDAVEGLCVRVSPEPAASPQGGHS